METTKAQIARDSHNQRKRRRQKEVQIKIGHGGTLDPLATGVLIAGVGKGTKALHDFLLCTKTYETIIIFGASTDTYDRTGKILRRAPYEHVTREMVEEALGQFRGKIMQTPPLYSALKMDGKPLYEYARAGKAIPREIEKREVEVEELELLEWYGGGTHEHKLPLEEAGEAEKGVAEALWKADKAQTSSSTSDESLTVSKRKFEEDQDGLVTEQPPSKRAAPSTQENTMSGGLADSTPTSADSADSTQKSAGPPAAKLRMTVTSGFYVRSLCHDLGEAVGSAANMAELVRSRQGQFALGKNVLDYHDLAKGENVWGPKVERYLDEWANNYRPLAASSVEIKNTAVQEVKPDATDEKKEAIEEISEAQPTAAVTAGEVEAKEETAGKQ